MTVWVEDSTFQYWGTGETFFINRSGDTLSHLFYHLYFNAFQPGSAMHRRAQAIHSRIADRINQLAPEEYGRLEMHDVQVNGQPASVHRFGTIARIDLAKPIQPGDTVQVAFHFRGQIPRLVRRAGRDNAQGIRFSMAQWYPKLCQYDQHGWQNNQYIGREFYGIWGTYDVTLYLPARYTVGATGVLQNPEEVGYGYQFRRDTLILFPQPTHRDSITRWHFIASPVHDFAWVADDAYAHQIVHLDTLRIHILFKRSLRHAWAPVADWIRRTLQFFGERYTPYPYTTFTCAQAGDGGMEYPQLIMITHRNRRSLLGVIVHEIGHQWFYGLVANNETKHAWMDEGFTTFITAKALHQAFRSEWETPRSWLERWLIPERPPGIALNLPHWRVVESGFEEPLTTPHDRFRDWFTARQVYSKGAAMLRQLEYSFGSRAVDSLLHQYVQRWRFRHPYPADFEKTCEDVFQQRLDAFFDTFIGDTEVPNYGFVSISDSVDQQGQWHTTVRLAKENRAHVPLRLLVRTADGQQTSFSIPMDIPYRSRPNQLPPWFWTDPEYTAHLTTNVRITSITFDTTGKLIDRFAGDNVIRNRWWLPAIAPIRVGLYTNFWAAQPLQFYGISLRPTVWYLSESGWQVGLRADGLIDFDRYRTVAGVYYNLGNRSWNWQFRFSHPLSLLHPSGRIHLAAANMDGVHLGQLLVSGTVRPQHYTHPVQIQYGGGVEFWHFLPSAALRSALLPLDQWLYRLTGALRVATVRWNLWLEIAGDITERLTPLPRWDAGVRLTGVYQQRFPIGAPQLTVTAAASGNIGNVHEWDRLQPGAASPIQRFRNPVYRFFSFLEDRSSPAIFLPAALRLAPDFPPTTVQHFAGISLSVEELAPLRSLASLLSAFTFEPYGTLLSWNADQRLSGRWHWAAEIGIDWRLHLPRLFRWLPMLLPPDVGRIEVRWRMSLLRWDGNTLRWIDPTANPAIGISRWALELATLWQL